MSDMTPFEQWWFSHVPSAFDDPAAKRLAREAWQAALDHVRQMAFESMGVIIND